MTDVLLSLARRVGIGRRAAGESWRLRCVTRRRGRWYPPGRAAVNAESRGMPRWAWQDTRESGGVPSTECGTVRVECCVLGTRYSVLRPPPRPGALAPAGAPGSSY